MDPSDNEDCIKQRVHHMLYNYAKTHLTTDHVVFTAIVFSQLRPHLFKEVPLADPAAFILPTDPFDAFLKLHSLDQPPRHEERFRANHEATLLLKRHLRIREGISKIEKIIHQDEPSALCVVEPLAPILTRRTTHAGLRGAGSLRSVPSSSSDLARVAGIHSVQDRDVPEPDIPYERTLKVTWAMKAEEREQPSLKPSVLHTSLYGDVSLVTSLPEGEFVPIFPRSLRLGYGKTGAGATTYEQGLKEFARVLPEANLGSDNSTLDFANETMMIVDGWRTLRVSSPPSPTTPTTSQEEDKVDQLFLEDSPTTEPLTGLISKKMGNIPTFLSLRLPKKEPLPSTRTRRKSPSPAPESVLGQPSIDSDISQNVFHSDSEGFATDIAYLCSNEDPSDIIMKVNMEEDKSDIFMEVPQLPPPNACGSVSAVLPTKLKHLTQDISVPYRCRPLKKALKGLSALRLSLSWVSGWLTFTVNTPLPSHQEISSVLELFPASQPHQKIDHLIQQALANTSITLGNRLAFLENIELPTIDEDPRPLIAISRKNGRTGAEDCSRQYSSSPKHKLIITSTHESHSPIGNDSTQDPKRLRTEDDIDCFLYEPSVLQFEDLVDVRMLYDTPEVIRRLSSQNVFTVLISLIRSVEYGANTTSYGSFTDGMKITPQDLAKTVLGDLGISATTLTDYDLVDLTLTRALTSIELQGPDVDSRTCRLAEFACLRAKTIASVPAIMDLPPSSSPETQASSTEDATVTIVDQSTMVLPDNWGVIRYPHRYMASLDFLQRQVIVRALRTPDCIVDLVERTSLGGVDIIVDPHSAIVVASLFTLPSHGKYLMDRILDHSWRFRYILVIFEAFPEALALRPLKSTSETLVISAYTPPILKAIKKLRRDVVIGEACGRKREECRVEYAFANDPTEAAKFVRYFGNTAEARDQSNGILWQSREWLDSEISPDEEDLSKIRGMNRMSALILLCKATADDILNMSQEERVEAFGSLVGVDVMELLNIELAEREMVVHTDLS
ncbi:hypothetical protein P691DRAFT_790582 [Macrolepiota fuliginosa MF-IS2]|uniref:Uncharacterized protein n=1 Tax=Macrolepiota fuliginosa MF-IS2 TaxID=1400762 RepID=A0A9P5XI99_9AGAR|nr:hypothetical protein P691DRAFT_790582 [Macrolepiota fuliginosa MF-IS2]